MTQLLTDDKLPTVSTTLSPTLASPVSLARSLTVAAAGPIAVVTIGHFTVRGVTWCHGWHC